MDVSQSSLGRRLSLLVSLWSAVVRSAGHEKGVSVVSPKQHGSEARDKRISTTWVYISTWNWYRFCWLRRLRALETPRIFQKPNLATNVLRLFVCRI